MNDETITAIAREYAEETVSMRHTTAIVADEAEDVIRFLLRRCCLVDKDKVREAFWQLTDKFLTDNDAKSFGAASVVLESLFPEIAKEVEG